MVIKIYKSIKYDNVSIILYKHVIKKENINQNVNYKSDFFIRRIIKNKI